MITGKSLLWTINNLSTGEDWTAAWSKSERAMRVSVREAKGQLPEDSWMPTHEFLSQIIPYQDTHLEASTTEQLLA